MIDGKDRKWCVYIHTSPSNKYYVGITSQKLNDRWRNGKGYKSNDYFTKAINKYGWDNIRHEVVASELTEEEAKNLEIELITKLQSNDRKHGYNITAGGDGTVGVSHYGEDNPFYGKHHTDKTKKINSETLKKMWQSGTLDEIICRPIYQFDLNGNYVASYKSIREAENETGIPHSVISRVCKNKLNYTHGYTWAYQDECCDFDEFKKVFLRRLYDKQKDYGKHLRKPVNLCDLSGNFISRFESASELAREFNVHKDAVSFACRNGSVFQYKYKCKYA